MIDTHTHLYLPEFADEADTGIEPGHGQSAAVERAVEAGVDTLIFPNVGLDTIAPMNALAAMWPENTFMAMGLHPTEIGDNYSEALATVLDELRNPQRTSYIAVGEVGIDLYWDRTFEQQQMDALDIQATAADELGLPVIIHCRDGLDQTIEVLSGHPAGRFLFHSFGGSTDDVDRIRRRLGDDCCFGINGIVTFKNSTLRDVLPSIGLRHIVTETDSPYLAPVPYRGKRNESAYIPLIIKTISSATGASPAEVADISSDNARRFFGI